MTSEPQLSGRRIQVVGVVGAGKTTFARRLGKELSIPVCELDSLFHKSRAGGAISADDARRTVQALVESNDEWILDAKYVVAVPPEELMLNQGTVTRFSRKTYPTTQRQTSFVR